MKDQKPPVVATVTLSDGVIVAIEKLKGLREVGQMVSLIGNLAKLRDLVRLGLSEQDKPKADTMTDEDALLLGQAILDLNVTPSLLKALNSYGSRVAKLAAALKGEPATKEE